jgi:hypothetical protein
MADAMFMYYVVAGIFAFLTAICFGTRAKRYKAGLAGSEAEARNKPEAA